MQCHYNNHLTIGFAGKRKHEKLGIVAGQLELLFKAFDEKLKEYDLHFVTGLADGADMIASDTFLKTFADGIKEKRRSCGAVLPFSRADYMHTINKKKEFERLFAACTQKLELDGINEKGKTPEHVLERAYQQQGRVLGYIADLFLAVAPKSEKGKTGGTKEALIAVLAQKKPVILLNLDDNKFYLYQTLEDWFEEAAAAQPEQILDVLFEGECVKTSTEPPEKQAERADRLILLVRKKAWLLFEHVFKGPKRPSYANDPDRVDLLQETLSEKQRELDDRAVNFQYQYRGGYVLTYILALFAVLLAITSSVFFSEMNQPGKENPHLIYVLIIIGLFKLLIVIGMLVNTENINNSEYNHKAIYYRYAAERLRVNCFISALGVLRSPRPNLGNHSKKHFANYMGETIYQRKIAPHLKSSFHTIINKDGLRKYIQTVKKDWIERQLNYHKSEEERMSLMDTRFRHWARIFSIGVIVIVCIDIVGGFSLLCLAIDPGNPWKERYEFAVPILLSLTAFFPAVVGTLNGIHFQSETHRLLGRCKSMKLELEVYDNSIVQLDQTIGNNSEGSDFFTVLKFMDNLANVLTDEVAEWSLIYEKRVDEPG